MDSYQAIFDAVRSRISNGDIGQAAENALREANFSHYVERACDAVTHECLAAIDAFKAPSAVYRPALSIDGNQWCALYGANLQDGVAGFGDTPADAMRAFDKAWAGSKITARSA